MTEAVSRLFIQVLKWSINTFPKILLLRQKSRRASKDNALKRQLYLWDDIILEGLPIKTVFVRVIIITQKQTKIMEEEKKNSFYLSAC